MYTVANALNRSCVAIFCQCSDIARRDRERTVRSGAERSRAHREDLSAVHDRDAGRNAGRPDGPRGRPFVKNSATARDPADKDRTLHIGWIGFYARVISAVLQRHSVPRPPRPPRGPLWTNPRNLSKTRSPNHARMLDLSHRRSSGQPSTLAHTLSTPRITLAGSYTGASAQHTTHRADASGRTRHDGRATQGVSSYGTGSCRRSANCHAIFHRANLHASRNRPRGRRMPAPNGDG